VEESTWKSLADNIKTDIMEIGWKGVGSILLSQVRGR
jgi:hypothetical protein